MVGSVTDFFMFALLYEPGDGHLRPSHVDFGDPASVGLELRRKGVDYPEDVLDPRWKNADLGKDFAVYLGYHHGKYGVGIKGVSWHFDGRMVGCEVFRTLDELKATWELD